MAYVTKTDVGRKRDHNEDASDAFDIRIKGVSYTVLVLADGMGGLEAGEIASSMFEIGRASCRERVYHPV